jgi:CO dehydrogenase maturation factor
MSGKIVVSISGKGGTGKTTLTSLLLKWLIENTEEVPLVVDADPATNLHSVLGMSLGRTVGQASGAMKKRIASGELSPTVPKRDVLEAWIFQTLVEGDRFDLLAMGRSEGEGCYCYVNSVLTQILDTLTSNYSVTLLDMEAGIEHLSRRTDRDVDVMLVVTDPSRMGFETAKRVKELISEVHVGVKRTYLVGNRFTEATHDLLQRAADEIGLELAGYLPNDDQIMAYNIAGKPLLELPEDSAAYRAIEDIVEKIGLDVMRSRT